MTLPVRGDRLSVNDTAVRDGIRERGKDTALDSNAFNSDTFGVTEIVNNILRIGDNLFDEKLTALTAHVDEDRFGTRNTTKINRQQCIHFFAGHAQNFKFIIRTSSSGVAIIDHNFSSIVQSTESRGQSLVVLLVHIKINTVRVIPDGIGTKETMDDAVTDFTAFIAVYDVTSVHTTGNVSHVSFDNKVVFCTITLIQLVTDGKGAHRGITTNSQTSLNVTGGIVVPEYKSVEVFCVIQASTARCVWKFRSKRG